MVSVIIPIYNEENVLSKDPSRFIELSRHAEVIFVDGKSSDKSKEIASRYARVISCPRGRASQMNLGARVSHSDILLFLHADTSISPDAVLSIKKIQENGFIGGCLSQRIEKEGFSYRFIEGFGNVRARITKVFYGDQGIFVRRDVFLKMGGFPEVPLMEDVIFTKRLRKAGKTVVLKDRIFVSPRRWETRGILKTIFLYSFLNVLFWFKVPLKIIKKLYSDLR